MKTINQIIILIGLTLVLQGCSQKKQVASWQLGPFEKPAENPILGADTTKKFFCPVKKDTVRWQRADVFNPGAIVKDGKVYLLTRCEDNPAAILGGRTSRIGLAMSDDGIHFSHFEKPVLYPDNDDFKQYDFPGGCEDPRVVETEDGTYVVAYTSWNYKVPRLSIAFSKDLMKWEKKGPAFAKAHEGKFKDMATKSASIITKMKDNRPVVAKIDGKYWMYWGEKFVNLAWSENLYDWVPLLDEKGALKQIMQTRPGHFDSDLTECGPPALMTDQGILLLYNGKNATNESADPKLPKGTYSVGQVLFDKNNPEKILQRTDTCILKPSLTHEITGQYKAGTTFSEGLVYFKNKWYLYYGTADSYIGVAVSGGK
ncbi:MAG TPA: glycoside hydrolase family 130 protein [Bacteroidales bacterium]|nr:glycoside hydrolase family 130 protein [Bacteroidales bacterium]